MVVTLAWRLSQGLTGLTQWLGADLHKLSRDAHQENMAASITQLEGDVNDEDEEDPQDEPEDDEEDELEEDEAGWNDQIEWGA